MNCSCACVRTGDERSLSAAPFKNHQLCKYGLLSAKQIRGMGVFWKEIWKDKVERIVESWKQKRKIQDRPAGHAAAYCETT